MNQEAITFFNLLCDREYFKPIVRHWIACSSHKFNNLEDLLTFWFEAWGRDAATSFSINWYNDSKTANVCLFDAREKKLIKKKNMSDDEKREAKAEKEKTKILQETFYIPKEMLCSLPPLRDAFVALLEKNLFTQNKLENKQFICFFKFKHNGLCGISKLILIVFETLQEVVSTSEKEYILFNYYLFKYRHLFPYLDGLFTTNGKSM